MPLMGARLSVAAGILTSLLLTSPALADTTTSTNWAGYAVHRPGVSFRTVQAAWRQPRLACHRGSPTFSSYWVGLGGYSETSQAIEQIGTEADCTRSGRARSTAWYELLPAPSMPIRLRIHPGDLMAAVVTVAGHAVAFTLEDLTTRRAFGRRFRAHSLDVSSAEWIVEAPSDCPDATRCLTLPLADFGSTSFLQSAVQTRRGHWGTISDPTWQVTKISLDPGGRRLVAASTATSSAGGAIAGPLDGTGQQFTVTYAGLAGGAPRGYGPAGSLRSTSIRSVALLQ